VQPIRNKVEFIQAGKTLADVVGLEYLKANPENYQKKYRDQITILEGL
jgi:hypothetical protein